MNQNSNAQKNWYVLYTKPRSERKAAANIADMNVEAYLPLHKVVRRWSDRNKVLEVPLFPNYLFVKADPVTRLSLYSIKEIVKFVSVEKKPVVVPDKEITAIRRILGDTVSENLEVSQEDYFHTSMDVLIEYGHFAGLKGTIIKKNGKTRLTIKIDGIMKAFSFNIHSRFVRPMHVGSSSLSLAND